MTKFQKVLLSKARGLYPRLTIDIECGGKHSKMLVSDGVTTRFMTISDSPSDNYAEANALRVLKRTVKEMAHV